MAESRRRIVSCYCIVLAGIIILYIYRVNHQGLVGFLIHIHILLNSKTRPGTRLTNLSLELHQILHYSYIETLQKDCH